MTDPVIQVEGLTKIFRTGFRRKRVEALRGIDFEVRRGEIVGLIGHNGAGKTTCMKVLTGLTRQDSGTARLFGQPAGDREARSRLGYLPENPYFYEHLTGHELLMFYGRMFDLGADLLRSRVAELLELVGLEDAADRQIKKYSKGMRQRIGIAQALVNDPDLVILDEPQSGLDPIGRKEVRDMIIGLHQQDKTVLLSTHILPDVEALADRVVLLAKGKVVATGTISELTGDRVEAWQLVLSGTPVPSLEEMAHSRHTRGDKTVLELPADIDVNIVLELASEQNCRVQSFNPMMTNLERLYVASTQEAK